MIIQALRYTLADTADSFDALLKPVLVSMLTTMLHDDDLENRRLAMTTLNSAAHNKPTLIKPQLGQLLPLVMKESRVKPELIREVQMGPFKHKVDDGLEVRKVPHPPPALLRISPKPPAYAFTLYSPHTKPSTP